MSKVRPRQKIGNPKIIDRVDGQVKSVLGNHIRFCFRYTQAKFKPSDGKDQKWHKSFLKKVELLSLHTIGEIKSLNKDSGTEALPVASLKSVKVPRTYPGTIEQVDVFRFGGKSHRAIGLFSGDTFHVFWIDYSLKLYKH